jgi:hypothetical protein
VGWGGQERKAEGLFHCNIIPFILLRHDVVEHVYRDIVGVYEYALVLWDQARWFWASSNVGVVMDQRMTTNLS